MVSKGSNMSQVKKDLKKTPLELYRLKNGPETPDMTSMLSLMASMLSVYAKQPYFLILAMLFNFRAFMICKKTDTEVLMPRWMYLVSTTSMAFLYMSISQVQS